VPRVPLVAQVARKFPPLSQHAESADCQRFHFLGHVLTKMIHDKTGFIAFLDTLPIADSTKSTYRNWVRRIDENLPKPLTHESVQSEADVRHLANLMPKNTFVRGHIKDVRCIIRYYLKFSNSKGVVAEQDLADTENAYSPKSPDEGRKNIWRSIVLRRGQKRFRDRLLSAYGKRCCVTGTDSEEVLEAAHIQPYAASGTNSVKNGLLLRSDIHVLFDLFLLSIDPTTQSVYCSKQIRKNSTYAALHGKTAVFPPNKDEQPDLATLRNHFEETKG
jgi:hypothetical protein